MNKNKPSEKQYYPFLDGVRAIAIGLVVINHIYVFFRLNVIFPEQSFIGKMASSGFIGVDIFFVVSGFLITGVLVNGYNAPVNIWRFFKRRFFKIYPQYLVCFFLCLSFTSIFSGLYGADKWVFDFSFTDIYIYLLFFQNYATNKLTLFEHAWSLAVEEHFYLLYPVLIWCIWKAVSGWHRKKALILSLCILILSIVLYRVKSNGMDVLSELAGVCPVQTTLMRLDALMAGCVLKLLEPYIQRMPRVLAPGFLLAGLGGIVVYLMGFIHFGWSNFLYLWICTCFMLIGSLQGWTPWNDFLENKTMRFVGRNSYGIYLWHYPIIVLIVPLTQIVPWSVGIPLYIIVALLFGVGSTQTVEKVSLRIRARVAP